MASALALAAALATGAGCIGAEAQVDGDEPDPAAINSRADAGTFVDKVTAGYQAWFGCPTSDMGTNPRGFRRTSTCAWPERRTR